MVVGCGVWGGLFENTHMKGVGMPFGSPRGKIADFVLTFNKVLRTEGQCVLSRR